MTVTAARPGAESALGTPTKLAKTKLDPKKILILVSSSGGGHIAAGKNIKQALELLSPPSQKLNIRIVDSYDFIHPFKKWQYTKGWQIATRFMPNLYRYTRNRAVNSSKIVKNLRKGFKPGAKKMAKYLEDFPAGTIIATHAHAAGVASILKESPYNFDFYLGQVYTDYQFHAFYLTKNVDHYFAPAEWVAVRLREADPVTPVSALGAPIQACFSLEFTKEELRKTFGLPNDDRQVVLVSRGSFGWGNKINLEIIRKLAQAKMPVHVMAHAGNKQALVAELNKIKKEVAGSDSPTQIHVLGWVNNMYALMAMVDLYIGKPGGMQVAEALAAGNPLLVFDPMPGQEDANVEFIEEQKVGALIKTPEQALDWINRFKASPNLWTTYKDNARNIGRPGGSIEIAREALSDNGLAMIPGDPDVRSCLVKEHKD